MKILGIDSSTGMLTSPKSNFFLFIPRNQPMMSSFPSWTVFDKRSPRRGCGWWTTCGHTQMIPKACLCSPGSAVSRDPEYCQAPAPAPSPEYLERGWLGWESSHRLAAEISPTIHHTFIAMKPDWLYLVLISPFIQKSEISWKLSFHCLKDRSCATNQDMREQSETSPICRREEILPTRRFYPWNQTGYTQDFQIPFKTLLYSHHADWCQL